MAGTAGKIGYTILIVVIALLAAVLVAASIFLSGIFAYLVILAVPLFAGWLVRKILHAMDVEPTSGVLIGVIAPIPALAILIAVFLGTAVFTSQVQSLNPTAQVAAIAALVKAPDYPLTSVILFYLLFNVFIIYILAKEREPELAWYVLAPAVLFGLWIGAGMLLQHISSLAGLS
jgi:hypothetical protein